MAGAHLSPRGTRGLVHGCWNGFDGDDCFPSSRNSQYHCSIPRILQSILQIVVSPTWALMLKLRFNVSMLINMLYCRISSMIEKEYSITLKPIKRKEKSVLIRLTTLREKWYRFRSKIAIGSCVSFILTRVISRRFPSGCWWNSRFLRKWVQIKAHPPPR